MKTKLTVETLMSELLRVLKEPITFEQDDSYGEPVEVDERVWVVRDIPTQEKKAILFDNDGTLIDLRRAWQEIMTPMYAGILVGFSEPKMDYKHAETLILDMIAGSIGKPTLCQCAGLAYLCMNSVDGGYKGESIDPRVFKTVYNYGLQDMVQRRYHNNTPDQLRIAGSLQLVAEIDALNLEHGIYVASGTDDKPTRDSLHKLEFSPYISDDHIIGAGGSGKSKLKPWECAKEIIIDRMIHEYSIPGECLAVIGDGPVEIKRGKEVGALSIGVASNEYCKRYPDRFTSISKRAYLIRAGADVIVEPPYNIKAILHLMKEGHTQN
jgi:phosphoglycolate phosphatase-like HAD superfamily hydrolase